MLNEAFKLLINGQLVNGDQTMDVINPATAQPVTTQCPRASEAQLNQAVAAAKTAFQSWKDTPVETRKAAISSIADALENNAQPLANILTLEQGKPVSESINEIMMAVGFFRHFATLDLDIEELEKSEQRDVELHRLPLGVVGMIVPWNFPIVLMAFKLPLALLCGNTVVFKPAPTTPLSALKIGELIVNALPPGVVNIIADNNDLGPLMTQHPDIRKVSFTGSTATGKQIMQSAASTLKRLTLELGGNDPAIVLDDVNVEEVAMGLFMSGFYNSGQICVALKRMYVHDSIYDELVGALAQIAATVPVGEGHSEGVLLGPVQNKKQYDIVQNLLEASRSQGTVLQDGPIPEGEGYFIRPAIVRDVTDGDRIVDEEQFGPVLPVIRYTDIDDAIARANASDYGLGASVWSSNIERAKEVAKKVNAGSVWINKHGDLAPHIPLAGMNMSGMGVELSKLGIDEFTQVKVINA